MFQGRAVKMQSSSVLPTSYSTRRARTMLESMVKSRTLTPGGLNWLVVASDPFHDSPIVCDGYPDVLTSSTITQCVTLSADVAVPTGVLGNWDCHVFMNPCTPSFDLVSPLVFFRSLVVNSGVVSQDGTGIQLFAGFNAISVPNGADWRASAVGSTTPQISFPDSFFAGYTRLVAAGFEVVNTTAELYKQGSVVSYRAPSVVSESTMYFPSVTTYVPTEFGSLPPSTTATATLFPNSRTWGAIDGVYSISTMNSTQNGFVVPTPKYAGLMSTPTPNELATDTPRLCYLPNSTTTTTGPCNHSLPFDLNGCIFSGLNVNSTLRVTARYYFERAPATSDPNLLVLARPSPPYDPVALELYSRLIVDMPVACRVDDNPMGEWFADLLAHLGSVAPMLGAALTPFFPAAGAIGTVLGKVAPMASARVRASQQRPVIQQAVERGRRQRAPRAAPSAPRSVGAQPAKRPQAKRKVGG